MNRRDFLSSCAAMPLAGPFADALGGGTAQLAWPSHFPAVSQTVNGHRLTYLDSAATTLRPQSVIDALADYYATDNANPSPVHTLASRAAQRLADARAAVARFVNAADPSEIVFVRGTSEGVNLVASTWGSANLRAGDEIILTIAEHNSNLMPWTRAARGAGATVRVLDVDDQGHLRLDQLERLLTARTRLVAFSHVSNVLGLVNPAQEIAALARKAGAAVFIDGAQGAPHVRVDVRALDCDFYAFSGHKMLGPMGTGVVWARRALLDAMPPYQVGSNMAHEVTFDREVLEHGAQKYQAGTPDVAGPVGLAAAIRFLQSAGADRLWQHDQDLVQYGLERLAAVRGLRLIGPRQAAHRIPVFTFVVDGQPPGSLARSLDQRGMAIRAGDMAALPLLERFGVREANRASAYVYSTRDDLDRLAGAIGEIMKS